MGGIGSDCRTVRFRGGKCTEAVECCLSRWLLDVYISEILKRTAEPWSKFGTHDSLS